MKAFSGKKYYIQQFLFSPIFNFFNSAKTINSAGKKDIFMKWNHFMRILQQIGHLYRFRKNQVFCKKPIGFFKYFPQV